MILGFSKRKPEKELENLKKAFDILKERYEKKTITIEEFTDQCNKLTKKIEKYQKIVDKNN